MSRKYQLSLKKIPVQEIVAIQKNTMRKFCSTQITGGSSEEAKEIERDLNTIFSFNKIADEKITPEKQSLLREFLDNLSKKLMVEIDENLGVKLASGGVQPNINVSSIKTQLKDRSAKNPSSLAQAQDTLRRSDIDLLIKQINLLNQEGTPSKQLRLLKVIEKRIQNLEQKIWASDERRPRQHIHFNTQNSQKSDIAQQINNLLQLANSILIMKSITGAKGEVGEYAIAAALSLMYGTIDTKNVDLLSLIEGKEYHDKNGVTVKMTGKDESQKAYRGNAQSIFTKQATFQKKHNYWSLNSTQDKVDIEVTIPDKEESLSHKIISASVKNYSNPNSVTILTGNIFPILNNYPLFCNRYINLIRSQEGTKEDKQSLYQTIKITTGIHALVGGVRAIKDDQLIKTPTANYLIVNNSSTGEKKVFSTADIGEQIVENVGLIDLMKSESQPWAIEDAFAKILDNSKYDSRFSGISVKLRVSQLKNSLPAKNLDK